MSSQPPPIPFPINPIFNVLDWVYDSTVLTVAIANTLYLQKAGDTATGLINFSAGLTATYASFSGLVTTNNTLTFRDATDDTGDITGTSGSLVLTALNDMTFSTNSGSQPLVLGRTTTTLQANDIVINASQLLTIGGSTMDINSGVEGINILGARIEIESIEVSIGVDTTTSISMGNGISTFELTSTTIDLTSSDKMTLASDSDMVLQALNNTNSAYIELDTTFIKTANTKEIDLTASGVIELTTASNMTLTGAQVNSTATTSCTFTTPNVTINSPDTVGTYLQLIPTYDAGLTDSATLFFGSLTQGANSYIGIDSLTSMAMAISSTGSIILNSAVDMVQLIAQPTYPSITPTAIATTQYVSTAIAAIPAPISDILIGSLTMYGGVSAPAGYLLCDGTQYDPATYPALYAVIGNTYGGVINTTFNVPDMRGRAPFGSETISPLEGITVDGGASSTFYTRQVSGGSKMFDDNQIAPHSHNNPQNEGSYAYSATSNDNTAVGGIKITRLITLETTPFNATTTEQTNFNAFQSQSEYMPPYCAVNYLIKT